jgi:PhoH-like ATPase
VADHRRGAEPDAEADEDADHARRPGTKVVCLGNVAQIDTPYLTEGSSGLTYVVDRMKDWRHAGHVTLARGERSRLADHAAEVL